MNEQTPNLFKSLFDCRPREGHTPKENFLTEAFVHILRNSASARDAWLSLVLGEEVKAGRVILETRRSERILDPTTAEETTVYPDLFVSAELLGEGRQVIYSEHKWDSDCVPKQLECYRAIASKSRCPARVIFIGKTRKQLEDAQSCLAAGDGRRRSFLWEEIFATLDAEKEKTELVVQLLDFMKANGLSRENGLNAEDLKALQESWRAWNSLVRILDALRNQDWRIGIPGKDARGVLPERFRKKRKLHEANGSRTVLFTTEGWRPAITVGFLGDHLPYKVKLANEQKGIDLILRLAAGDAELLKDGRIDTLVMPILREKATVLSKSADSVRLLGDQNNGDRHTLLIVQMCLADLIAEDNKQSEAHDNRVRSESSQIDAIYRRLCDWGEALFEDGQLDKALRDAGLDADAAKSDSADDPNEVPAVAGTH